MNYVRRKLVGFSNEYPWAKDSAGKPTGKSIP
jgi:hypothetical protein